MRPSWLTEVEGSQSSVALASVTGMMCYRRASLPPLPLVPKDAELPNVEASHLEHQHPLALVVPYSTEQLQVDASDGCG
jgi:hypothetical protein